MAALALIRYDAACRAIAAAKRVDELKGIVSAAAQLRAAAKVAKNRRLEVDAQEIRIRAEHRIGELIEAQRETIGLASGREGKRRALGSKSDPSDRPTLADAGIDKHLADRARKLRAMGERFERRVSRWRDRQLSEGAHRINGDVLAPINHVSQNSGDSEWFSPESLVEPARKVLGQIDLDPASTPAANQVIKATEFFTAAQDGLKREWAGRVWLNPPYARPLVDHFADKLVAEFTRRSVPAAVTLVNNATETEWFQAIATVASAICFPKARIRFWHPSKSEATPLQGQALLYLGPHVRKFEHQFRTFGIVWVKP